MKHRILLSLTILALLPLCAKAVQAKRGIFTITQADGTELRVQLRGDERHHITLSEDNCLLIEKGGIFFFAEINQDGKVAASAQRAENPGERSAETSAFVARLDQKILLERLEAERSCGGKALAPRRNIGRCETNFPTKGDVKSLIVLVEYQDVKFTIENPHDYFSRQMTEPGFSDHNSTGSCTDYFLQQSNNQFRPQFDVYGPITLSQDMAYYGENDWSGNDKNPQKMAIEACQQLDDEVDFNQYDCDNDGYIDNIYIIYAGRGEASSSIAETVWPHSWSISAAEGFKTYVFDNVVLENYACSNEWEGTPTKGRPNGIGTFCHEFSHILGLPDLYATNLSKTAFTPGNWDVMDSGNYNHDSRTPPSYSIFERFALGWTKPQELGKDEDVTLAHIEQSNQGYIIPTTNGNEFFLLENRQKTGWDSYIPGHGMLIWHIDYNPFKWEANTVNDNAQHQYVDIEEADNKKSESNRAGDAFPGTANITSFTNETQPSMTTWAGEKLHTQITNIQEDNGLITFHVADETNNPIEIIEIDASQSGEGTGFFDLTGRRIPTPRHLTHGIYLKKMRRTTQKIQK